MFCFLFDWWVWLIGFVLFCFVRGFLFVLLFLLVVWLGLLLCWWLWFVLIGGCDRVGVTTGVSILLFCFAGFLSFGLVMLDCWAGLLFVVVVCYDVICFWVAVLYLAFAGCVCVCLCLVCFA